jgi:cyclic pyranopterin phosphate synthase
MIDITHKYSTLRSATASATVKVSKEETIAALINNAVPKGNVFEMAKTAGLFGVKKTAEMIPDCHPLPIEETKVEYEVNGLEITILMHVKTIYKTGVEVEAMHGVSVVALTMYDMLKPIDKGIEINNIRLVKKKGGKSDFAKKVRDNITATIVVCSDTISAGQKEDKAGIAIQEKLKSFGLEVTKYVVIPDEKKAIEDELLSAVSDQIDLVIYTGGTGLSKRDVTPDTILPLLDREIPGIMEASRKYGQDRTPYAMLSRGVAGVKDETLVITLPGSTKGSIESMDAIFPAMLHLYSIFKGKRHD